MAVFGHFTTDGKEYVIDKPLLPIRHLINFSWNNSLISGVNQFGTGEGVFNNQTLLYNDLRGRARMIKNGARYFYVRDEESKAYWNIGYYPVKHEPFELKTAFGPGYSKFIHTTEKIKTESLCFVVPHEPVEVWKIKICNLRDEARNIKIYPYVEWLLQGYPIASDYYSYLKSEYFEDINTVISFNLSDERPHERYSGFVASSIKPTGYAGSVREFMGIYGEATRPKSVAEGNLPGKPACNENLAGALEVPVILGAGESKEVIFLIGNTSDIAETRRIVNKLLSDDYINRAFKSIIKSKEAMANHTVIKTPNERINYLINLWAKNQVSLCAEFGRDGVRGFRDTLQDAWAILTFDPQLARQKIIESLMHQNSDGSTLRGWMPIMKKHYSDGPTWIIPAVVDYIKYTGDETILDEVVDYFDKGRATVFEHMLAALRHLRKERGIHGLCLAFQGDWNDSLDWMGKEGKGESVMTSMAYYRSLKLFLELLKAVKKDEGLIKEFTNAMEEIKQAIEENAWDGNWYIQGYSDYGNPVGSKQNSQGKISLVPQAWAAYSGVAPSHRIDKCFKAVKEYLDAKTGCKMCHPPFNSEDKNVGRLTVILPGMYENASTYCHGSAFMIAAYLEHGKINEAYELYQKVMPDSIYYPSDLSGVEPYAFTNQYLGPDSKRAGVSVSGWITGTAGWMYRIMINYFLGIQPHFNGIYLKPCMPDEWSRAEIKTSIRNREYYVKILKDSSKKSGMIVNQKEIEGNFVPYGNDEKVDITLYI